MDTNKSIKTIAKRISKTSKDVDPMISLRKKLKACDFEIQEYVKALTSENMKLQKQISQCLANNISLNNRVKVLMSEKKKNGSRLVFHMYGLKKKNDKTNDKTQK